jgi:hypothetical protein
MLNYDDIRFEVQLKSALKKGKHILVAFKDSYSYRGIPRSHFMKIFTKYFTVKIKYQQQAIILDLYKILHLYRSDYN